MQASDLKKKINSEIHAYDTVWPELAVVSS